MVLSRFFQRQQAAAAAHTTTGLGDVATLDDTAAVPDTRTSTDDDDDLTRLFRKQSLRKNDNDDDADLADLFRKHSIHNDDDEGEEDLTRLFRKQSKRNMAAAASVEHDAQSVETRSTATGDFPRFLADTTDDMTVATSTSNDVMNRIKRDFLQDFAPPEAAEDTSPVVETTSRWGWATRTKPTAAVVVSDDDSSVDPRSGATPDRKKAAVPSWGVGWRTSAKPTITDASSSSQEPAIVVRDDDSNAEELVGGSKDELLHPVVANEETARDATTSIVAPAPRKGWGWTAALSSSKAASPGANATLHDKDQPSSALASETHNGNTALRSEERNEPVRSDEEEENEDSDRRNLEDDASMDLLEGSDHVMAATASEKIAKIPSNLDSDDNDDSKGEDCSDQESSDGCFDEMDDNALANEASEEDAAPHAMDLSDHASDAEDKDHSNSEDCSDQENSDSCCDEVDDNALANVASEEDAAPHAMDLSDHESDADDNDHSNEDDRSEQVPSVEEAEDGEINHPDDDSSKLNNGSDSGSEEDDMNQENVLDEGNILEKHGNDSILDTKPAQRMGWGWKSLVATTPLVSSKTNAEVVPISSYASRDASMEGPQLAPASLPVPTHTTNMRGGRDIDDESVSEDSDHNECVDEGDSCEDLDKSDISNASNHSEVMVVNHSNESAPTAQRKGWGWKALVTTKTISGDTVPNNKPVQSQTLNDDENEEKDDSRGSDDSSTLDNGDNDGVDDINVSDSNDGKANVREYDHPDDSIQAAQRKGWGWKALAAKTMSSVSKTSDEKATTASSVTSLAESKKLIENEQDHGTGTSVTREAMSPSDSNHDIGSNDDEDSDSGDNLEKHNIPTNMVLDDMVVNSIVSSPETILEGTMTTPPIPPLDLNTAVSDESDCNSEDVSEGGENVSSDDDCESDDSCSDATPHVPPRDINAVSSDVCGSENECVSEAGENDGLDDDSEFDGSDAEAPPPVPPLDTNIDVSEECGSNCDDVTEGSVNVSSDDDNDCDDQDSEGRDVNSDPDSCGGSEISEELEMRYDRPGLDLHDNDASVNTGNTDDDRNFSVCNNYKENTSSDDSDTNCDTTMDGSLEKFNSENVTLDEREQICIKTTADMKLSPNDALDCCSIEQHEASEKSSSCLNSSSGSLFSQSESMKEESDDRSDSCSSNMEPRGTGSDLGKSFEIVHGGNLNGSQPKGIDSSSLHESNHDTGTSISIPCTETEFPKDEIEACDDSAMEAEKSFQGISHLIEDRPASKVLSHQMSNESLSESVASSQHPGSNAKENHISKTENKRGWGWFAKKNSVQNETVSTGVCGIPTNSFSSEELNVQESKDSNVAGATASKSETARRPWGWFAAKNQNDDSDDSQSEVEQDVLKASDHEQSNDSPESLDDNVDFLKEPTHVMQQTIVLDNSLFPNAVETESHSLPDENEPCLLKNSPEHDSEDSLSANSNSDEETNHSGSGKPFRLVVKQAPVLRLENFTSSTRNKITDDRDQKKDKTWWFSKKNESGEKSDSNAKSDDMKSSMNIHEKPGIDSETSNVLENGSDSLIVNSATYGIGADPQTQIFASNEGKQVSSAVKQKKKKKSKVSDISTLLESRKSTRLVSRHGDEVSVGTLNIKAQEPSRIVVLSASNALLDESELCPRSRPWEKSIRKGPKRSHSSNQSPSPLEDINILSSDIEVLFQNDPFESTSDIFSKDTTKSNLKMHMPSLHEEDESDDNDNVSVSKDTAHGTSLRGNIIEDVHNIDTLLEITDLEQRLIESNDSVKMDFDQMWDDVSCDGSTALEFDRIKRKRNHEKERKRKRREKEKSDKDNAARRLRLFERRKERDDQLPVAVKKASEMQSKLSEEFVDAIHKVFDDGSVNSMASSVEQSTAGVDNFDEGSKNGSCHSLYLPSEVSENNEDDKSHLSGNEISKNQINGQKSPFEESSVDDMGTVSLSKNKAKSKGNRQHDKTIKKGKKRSKRSEIDSSEIFLAEVERLKKPKVFTIASLKQEMIDRRGTSVNFLKKEYVNYRKKRNDRRKAPLDNELKPLDFGALSEQMKNKKVDEKADIFDSTESKSDSGGLGAKLSRWVATEGVTGLDDLATVVETPAPSHNIFGVAANLAKNAAAAIPDIPLSQDIQALGRDAGKVVTSAGATIYSGGQTIGTNVAHVGERVGRTVGSNLAHGTHAIADGINQGTHAVGKGLNRVGLGGGTENAHRTEKQTEATPNQTSDDDMNLFTANFSDVPLTSIQEVEDDDDDDFGLLASHKKDHNDDSYNDDDGDDSRSHEIRTTGGSRLPFKMGKLKPPKLGKTIKKLVPKLPSMQKRGDSGRSGGFRMGGSNKGYGGMGLLD